MRKKHQKLLENFFDRCLEGYSIGEIIDKLVEKKIKTSKRAIDKKRN